MQRGSHVHMYGRAVCSLERTFKKPTFVSLLDDSVLELRGDALKEVTRLLWFRQVVEAVEAQSCMSVGQMPYRLCALLQ